jgi:putative DNA primase/helicase
MSDYLPILTAVDGAILAKVISKGPEGWETKPYDNAYRYRFSLLRVDSLEDVQALLEQLAQDNRSCVIRGEPRDGGVNDSREVNRRTHVDKEGRPGDWDNHHEGRQWVAFDVDAFEQTAWEGSGVPDEAAIRSMVVQARSELLGAPWTRAACVYKLSASAGLRGWRKVSMHLWFWLDRRVHDLSLRAWAKGKGVDAAFFSAVQPHYTANPVFTDGVDPLAGRRMGRLPGADVVVAPPELIGGEAWREADRQRREAQAGQLEKARRAIMADIPQSKSGLRAYGLKTLSGVCSDILGAAEGTRHRALLSGAYNLGGYCQPDCLAEVEVIQALTRTVEVVFDAKRQPEELRTMREMVEAGAKQPRALGHLARKSGQRHLSVVPAGTVGNAALKAPEPPGDDEEGGRQPAGMMLQGVRDNGTAPMSSDNLRELLRFYGIKVQWNEMGKEGEVTIPLAVARTEMRENTKVGRIRELARQHGMPGGQAFDDAMLMMEDEGAYHPARDWVLSKPWDGVERFEALWRTVVVREDKRAAWGDLYREQLYRWCIGAAKLATLPKLARVTGQQVAQQGVLVLQGPQGKGKTEWFKALAPAGLVSTGVTVDPSNKDDVIKATSTWITELGEIDSTVRKADVGHLKAFLTSASDTYRRAYARVQETYLRRTSFGASVNPEAFLRDTTGNRRFWVVPIERMLAFRDDPDGLPHLDMQQLWAEMAVHAQRGEPHYLGPEFTRAQEAAAEEHRQRDPLEDEVLNAFVIDQDMAKAGWLTTEEVYRTLQPERPLDKWSTADKIAVGRVLNHLKALNYMGNRARKWSLRKK